jgi:hypothetical protein
LFDVLLFLVVYANGTHDLGLPSDAWSLRDPSRMPETSPRCRLAKWPLLPRRDQA